MKISYWQSKVQLFPKKTQKDDDVDWMMAKKYIHAYINKQKESEY